MRPILVILAHPHLQHSRVNRAMQRAVAQQEHVIVHDLYELYPDYAIDVRHEQQALEAASGVVLQHPLRWYSCPALLKEWLDAVLQRGWAYGEGGRALAGKFMLSAVSAGGPEQSYHAEGSNRYGVHELLRPFEQTAQLCGMEYHAPFTFFGANGAGQSAIDQHAARYRGTLAHLAGVEDAVRKHG